MSRDTKEPFTGCSRAHASAWVGKELKHALEVQKMRGGGDAFLVVPLLAGIRNSWAVVNVAADTVAIHVDNPAQAKPIAARDALLRRMAPPASAGDHSTAIFYTLGWQWTAGTGTDAAPYFRIFNPVTQSRRFDPKGAFIRKYLPELAALSDEALHAPRAPVVEHAAARARPRRPWR